MPDTNQRSGVCYLVYNTVEQAEKALQNLSGKLVHDRPLYVNKLQSKEQRAAQAMQQQQQTAMMPFMMMQQQQRNMQMRGMPMPMPFGMFPQGMQMPPMGAGQMGAPRFSGQPSPAGPGPRGGPMPVGARGFMPQQQQPRPQQPQQPAVSQMARNLPMQSPVPTVAPVASVAPAAVAPQQPQYAAAVAAAPVVNPQLEALEAKLRATNDPAQRKRAFGEQLYPQIAQVDKERAGKITGMLLELEEGELRNLLKDTVALRQRISEALTVLNA